MQLASLTKRIAALEPESVNHCPFCESISGRVDALSDDDLRDLIAYTDGGCIAMSPALEEFLFNIPESSPSCPHCRETAAMSEEEAEKEWQRLVDILRDVI